MNAPVILPNRVRRSAGLFCALLSVAVAGCAVGPNFVRPDAAVQTNWLQSADMVDEVPEGLSAEGFWESFHDQTLLELIKKADQHSPTLLSAVELVAQARSQVSVDYGNLLPTVDVNGGSTYSQPTTASELKGMNEGATTDQLLGQLSWELDFWGRLRRAVESDKANLAGAKFGLAAARVSLEASVASAYCNVRVTEQRIAVAKKNLVQQGEEKRIADTKFRLGASSELDYRQAEAQFEQTNSQLPGLRQSLEQYQHSLSVLVGEPPDYFVHHVPANAGLPNVPTMLPIGAPRDLLRRRPDVLQAEYAAAAQSARIGVAKAVLFPTFTLTGEFGYATTGSLNTLFRYDNRAVEYGAGFTLPIFDRGKLKAEVRIADSVFRQAVLNYQNQVLTAQQNVEDGLSSIAGEKGQVDDLGRADAAAARATVLALAQYRAGQVDYTR
jgi:NodT family efflux transporter outer membrane factor (OMF) lipoprotein